LGTLIQQLIIECKNQVHCQINQTVVGKKESNDNTKMRTYKIVYLRTLLSGSEIWIMLTKYESRIYRHGDEVRKKCVGKARRDIIRNSQISKSRASY